jgi:hypothetical protein
LVSLTLTDLSPLEQTPKPYPAAPIDELPDGVEVRGEASPATVRGDADTLVELEGLGTPGEIRRVKYVFPFPLRIPLCSEMLCTLVDNRGYEIGRAFWQEDVVLCAPLASGHVSTFTRSVATSQ